MKHLRWYGLTQAEYYNRIRNFMYRLADWFIYRIELLCRIDLSVNALGVHWTFVWKLEFFKIVIWDSLSLCALWYPSYLWTSQADITCLEMTEILLSLLTKGWGYRCAPPYPAWKICLTCFKPYYRSYSDFLGNNKDE